ncbi:uncharacterized protein METZ01_LOCUS445395 [marine metagenome]|uniref:Uncharacterized protein n=1 Tax=marine metagenome TaxID=408172 RepID=A0A382ZAM1_9ZZZZ
MVGYNVLALVIQFLNALKWWAAL